MKIVCTVTLLAALTLTGSGAAMAQASVRSAAPRTPHPTAGKTDCLSCHAPQATAQVMKTPEAHKYANPACLACHRLAATMPPPSRHAMDAAHTRCGVCHVAGSPTHAKPVPASHTHRNGTTCQMCHQQAATTG